MSCWAVLKINQVFLSVQLSLRLWLFSWVKDSLVTQRIFYFANSLFYLILQKHTGWIFFFFSCMFSKVSISPWQYLQNSYSCLFNRLWFKGSGSRNRKHLGCTTLEQFLWDLQVLVVLLTIVTHCYYWKIFLSFLISWYSLLGMQLKE